MEKLVSEQDASVNFVESQLEGFLESRYVRRKPEYFVCYLSSHTGCNRGCRFCHLTATKQTSFKSSTKEEFMAQAEHVFEHWRDVDKDDEMSGKGGWDGRAAYVHFNFMARGEPLENEALLRDGDGVLLSLARLAIDDDLNPKFNVSTIMPKTLDKPLTRMFRVVTPTIYYSIYSVDKGFRAKWLPAAMEPERAFGLLKDYQAMTKKIVKVHFAFIAGENDRPQDVAGLVGALVSSKLKLELNIVRYNPFSAEQGKESDEATFEKNVSWLSKYVDTKVITRVGQDVYASCGTFFPKESVPFVSK